MVVSDAAALASALARLDEDLRVAAHKAGCDDLVQALTPPEASYSRSPPARSSASLGPARTTVMPDRWREPEARVHPVAGDSDVPRALEALTALLRNARVLKPEHVQQIAISLARVELRIHRGTTTDLAGELAAVAGTPRRTACPFHGDRRPLLQAAELNRWASKDMPPSVALRAVAQSPLLECLTGLHSVVRRQLQSGNWLVPDPDPDARLPWRRWTHALEEPDILATLRVAAQGHPGRASTAITA